MARTFTFGLFVSFTLTLCTPSDVQRAQAAPATARPLKVLFLGDQGHHRPADRAAQITPVLAGRGIQVTYTEKLADLNPQTLAAYDALLIYANINDISPSQEKALLDYVEGGGGFVPLHCASYCFLNSPRYIALVGAQFQRHGTGEFDTRVVDPSHPMMKGLEPFHTWDETYVHHKHNDKDRHLLQVRSEGRSDEPWTWVRAQGNGRVFYTAYGHDARTWQNPGFHDLVERGIRWASAKGEVFDSRGRVAAGLPPFSYSESDVDIPNYLPGRQWGTQGAALHKMQKPLSPAESQRHLVVPAGFEPKLFAAEPEIYKPLCMAWDHRGRLWIGESTDYPNTKDRKGQGRDRITLCEDTNGDGRADSFRVFAEGLNIPTSLLYADGGLIVLQAPDTLFLKDTDGDGKADLRKVLFTGWGISDTHAGPSNLRWGLDNWVWGIVGYSAFRGTAGGESVRFGQGLFRFKPDGSKLEFIRSTNNNSWGVGFSEDGLVFGSTANGCPSVYLPIPNRYYESVRGMTPRELRNIAATNNFFPITEKVRQVDWHGGFTAGAGHALYTARAYPPHYWNSTAFVAEPTGHLVATFTLERKGSDVVDYNGWNLVASDDEWTAPINAEVGPDGQVWVIDWYNYIVQHNPTPHGFKTGKGNAYETPLRDQTHGRIYRIVYGDGAAAKAPALDPADPSSLVAALGNDNQFWRLHAQRLLIERGKTDVVPELVRMARDPSVDAIGLNGGTVHALWTLQGLGALNGGQPAAVDAAVAALGHPSAGVRRNAVQVLPHDDRSSSAVLKAGLLRDPDAQVRLAALLSLADQPPSGAVAIALVEALRTGAIGDDRWLADAATAAAAKNDTAFLKAIAARKNDRPASPLALSVVGRVAEHWARSAPGDTVGGLVAALPGGEPTVIQAIIQGLTRGWPKGKPARIDRTAENVLKKLSIELNPESRGQLVRLVGLWGNQALDLMGSEIATQLLAAAGDEKATDRRRIDAARQVVELRSSDESVARQLLELIGPRTAPDLAAGLIESVSVSKSPRVGSLLVEALPRLSPAVRGHVLKLLLGHADWSPALVDALEHDQAKISELALDQKQALAAHPNRDIAARASKLLARGGGLPDPDRQKVLERLLPLVKEGGDVAKGKLVFQEQCAKCHRHGSEGGQVGPDLSGSAALPRTELLTNIIDPSRSVEGNFVQYNVATVDGRVINGLLASETKTSIELIDVDGKRQPVLREDVDQMTATKKSLMPEGFEKQVSTAALNDLLAFLTQRGKYLPLDLRKVATVVSTRGMFYDEDGDLERLVFSDWSPKTVDGVPFLLIDPQVDRVRNAVLLYGPEGKIPPRMPRSVEVPCNAKASAIHLLSGVSGWGFPYGRKGTVSMIVRLHYADGTLENHPLENGVHFADYIRVVDVPGSKLAFNLRGQQIRYLAVKPLKKDTIERIELVKGPDQTAPIVMALTVEVENALDAALELIARESTAAPSVVRDVSAGDRFPPLIMRNHVMARRWLPCWSSLMFKSTFTFSAGCLLSLAIAWSLTGARTCADEITTNRADEAPASVEPFDAESDGLVPPPRDPWSTAPPQARGQRPTSGDGLVYRGRITPHWFNHDNRFWYRNDLAGRTREFVAVDAEKGTRSPAFDHQKLAAAFSKVAGNPQLEATRLPFDSIEFTADFKSVLFRINDVDWKCDLEKYECSRAKPGDAVKGGAQSGPPSSQSSGGRRTNRRDDDTGDRPGGSRRSPDGKWTALIKDHKLFVRPEGKTDETRLSEDGTAALPYGRLSWAPDSKTLVAYRIEPGERKEVYLIQSSPPNGGRAKLQSRPYPLPGDKFTSYELNLFDVAAKKAQKPKVDRVDFDAPRLRWSKDGHHFTYQKIDRGHQRFRLIEVDSHTGEARNLIDEKSDTFIWTAHREAFNFPTVTWLDDSDEIIYISERDGWRHLYLIDAKTGRIKNPITRGAYVVRGVDQVDEAKRQIWLRAGGKNPDQDPYFIHYYRVGFDGNGLVALTEGDGSHTVQYSPDRRFLIDTYSRVDLAPVHELRRVSDGRLVCSLERADASALLATGWKPPEVFVAKGRDGKTDIWGIVCRPRNYDPAKKYPVIEQIYAGPQGSFVPKTFSTARRFSFLTDLGFIVVQMDGMGTANRSKAFHDVCWHNLKDAGFPDRILWHQALAKRDPSYDITRVGIYGTSAGGQNAAGGVLFYPDFYKVAAAACGCHDNRMDKASWNEQWMGYPVGPWYAASSNVDNAQRLQGKLLLIVGELDTNVPPESTMRVVDALIKAGKDFDLIVVPGANHGMGAAYGQRRIRDFFVRHLQASEPADRSAPSAAEKIAARPANNGHSDSSRAAAQESSSVALELADCNGDRSELRGAIERYTTDRGTLQRSLPPSASPGRDAQVRSFAKHWLDRIGNLEFDRLSQDGKVDYLLLKNHLAHELRELDIRGREQSEAAAFVSFGKPILDLDQGRRELQPMDWAKVAGTLADLTRSIGEARRALDREPRGKAPVKRAVANRALATVESLRSTLRGWYGFYDGYDPLFTWWMAEPYKTTDAAIESYAGALRQKLGAVASGLDENFGPGIGRRRGGGGGGGGGGGPREETPASAGRSDASPAREREIVGNPIGREALLSELQYEMIAYTPEELIELARTELAWCEDQMKKAAREMGKGDDWKAALEYVKTLYVEPGKQPTLIRDLANEAIEYMDAHDLVTIPELCRDSWRMAMMSPERQLVNPFFTGGEVISVSFPTNSMPHEAKLMSLRGNNRHFSRATVFHEVIPGHHLQQYMMARHKTYRRLFNTPFWMEGWALYWELLLWDKGFAKSPENRVGMLFWRMHRCARIIFSLGFHLEKMTPKECIDFLVDKIGHERDNATAEVRRSFTTGYGPLYQAAYLLGGLQLRGLHRELVETGKMTDRQFHDAILKENAIPIEMVRALLAERKLTPDFKPDWKFYAQTPSPH